MKNCYFTLIILFSTVIAQAQWGNTPSPSVSYRYDDVFFLNPDLGWAVVYANTSVTGKIIKTTDGAQTWQTVLSGSGAAFRDIAFTDSLHGWVGTLQSGLNPQDTIVMYQTVNSGVTWTPVTNFPGPRPAGICGMTVINDSTVYAVGRYFGSPGFYKTTDNGQTWSYTDMSAYAGGLVDIYFMSPDSGFAVGSSGTWDTGNGRVLFTSDAGTTWQIRHTSTHPKEICWKISFPSPNIGYVSLESFRGTAPQYFLKTTDGGLSWQDLVFTTSATYNAQGIGFINDTTGWIGGSISTHKTTNGGATWALETWGNNVNRFRFFSDTIAYSAGSKIYKFDPSTVSVEESDDDASDFDVYPNPFNNEVTISFRSENSNSTEFIVRNILGQTLIHMRDDTPIRSKTLNLSSLPSGIFLLEVKTDEERTVKKILKK